MKKRCGTCDKSKPVEEFNKHPKTRDGYASSCRECSKAYDRAYFANPNNAEKIRKRAKEHYWANRDKKLAQVSKYQFDRKVKATAILGGKCFKCPETHPAALQFHHKDPATKVLNLSSKTLAMPKKFPWNVIEMEIEKCELLCANCHAKYHTMWDQWM